MINNGTSPTTSTVNKSGRGNGKRLCNKTIIITTAVVLMATTTLRTEAFSSVHQTQPSHHHPVRPTTTTTTTRRRGGREQEIGRYPSRLFMNDQSEHKNDMFQGPSKFLASVAATAIISASFILGGPGIVHAENELSAKYGGKGFDSSLVDQNCLIDKCSLQAKACFKDDPSCRKGLTCTAKCLGDNACITGCMARYGDQNLDNLLKCTIEDNECIKVAILDGGADKFGTEPRPPAPTVRNFNLASMEGAWYKVMGFNPNYDCYACQRNVFSEPTADSLQVDVQFSMPRMLPDGSPPPPSGVRESVSRLSGNGGVLEGAQSIAYNDYNTHETMVFDTVSNKDNDLVTKRDGKEVSFSRTAHSEGQMFGLKFWENWYVIGENDPDQPEFKFIFYNGKTRQNTYEGAFVYSRTRDLGPEAMTKVYQIASDAGMNPDQFCKIQNGCFDGDSSKTDNVDGSINKKALPKKNKQDDDLGAPANPFRGLLASTKVSQLLGVEPVAAEGEGSNFFRLSSSIGGSSQQRQRAWWYEIGDYIENPHRHFKVMDDLRETVVWPDSVRNIQK